MAATCALMRARFALHVRHASTRQEHHAGASMPDTRLGRDHFHRLHSGKFGLSVLWKDLQLGHPPSGVFHARFGSKRMSGQRATTDACAPRCMKWGGS